MWWYWYKPAGHSHRSNWRARSRGSSISAQRGRWLSRLGKYWSCGSMWQGSVSWLMMIESTASRRRCMGRRRQQTQGWPQNIGWVYLSVLEGLSWSCHSWEGRNQWDSTLWSGRRWVTGMATALVEVGNWEWSCCRSSQMRSLGSSDLSLQRCQRGWQRWLVWLILTPILGIPWAAIHRFEKCSASLFDHKQAHGSSHERVPWTLTTARRCHLDDFWSPCCGSEAGRTSILPQEAHRLRPAAFRWKMSSVPWFIHMLASGEGSLSGYTPGDQCSSSLSGHWFRHRSSL